MLAVKASKSCINDVQILLKWGTPLLVSIPCNQIFSMSDQITVATIFETQHIKFAR